MTGIEEPAYLGHLPNEVRRGTQLECQNGKTSSTTARHVMRPTQWRVRPVRKPSAFSIAAFSSTAGGSGIAATILSWRNATQRFFCAAAILARSAELNIPFGVSFGATTRLTRPPNRLRIWPSSVRFLKVRSRSRTGPFGASCRQCDLACIDNSRFPGRREDHPEAGANTDQIPGMIATDNDGLTLTNASGNLPLIWKRATTLVRGE